MLGWAVFKNLIAIRFQLLQLCHSVPSPVFTPTLFQLGIFRFCSICCIVQLPVGAFALISVFGWRTECSCCHWRAVVHIAGDFWFCKAPLWLRGWTYRQASDSFLGERCLGGYTAHKGDWKVVMCQRKTRAKLFIYAKHHFLVFDKF